MRRFIHILGLVSGTVLVFIMGLMCLEIFCRYVLHKPILGTVEISSYLLVLFVFIGMSYTQSIDGHIKIDLLTVRLSPKVQHVFRIIALVMALSVFAVITWKTSEAFLTSWRMREVRWGALPLPVYPVKFVVAAGSLILCIQFMINIIDELQYKIPGPRKE